MRFPVAARFCRGLKGMRILSASRLFVAACGLVALAPGLAATAAAQVIPGTGSRLTAVGDDFEDEKWAYNTANPKSSHEQDDQIRNPAGYSTNGRWSESAKRGHPDVIERVRDAPGRNPGQQRSAEASDSGIRRSRHRSAARIEQDDLICNVQSRLAGTIPVSSSPSLVVRVLIPPFEKWEQRQGNSFGVRLSLEGYKPSDGDNATPIGPACSSTITRRTAAERGQNPGRDRLMRQLVLRGRPDGQRHVGTEDHRAGLVDAGHVVLAGRHDPLFRPCRRGRFDRART